VSLCGDCAPALEREALFRVYRDGSWVGFVCVKHAGEIRNQPGVKLALVDTPPAGFDPTAPMTDFPPLPGPPIEGYTAPPAPALERKPLTVAELDKLDERMAAAVDGSTIVVEGDQLRELVLAYRLWLACSELVRDFKGPRP
jgi:hypothetical protein